MQPSIQRPLPVRHLAIAAVLLTGACSAAGDDADGRGKRTNGNIAAGAGGAGGDGAGNLFNSPGPEGAAGMALPKVAMDVLPDDMFSVDDCPGAIAPNLVAPLQADNVQTVSPMRWLYPYDATVFPRGLKSPLLQWDEAPEGTEAVYLKLTSQRVHYQGCLVPTAPGQLQIPQDVWEAVGAHSNGKGDPLQMTLVTIAGGQASALPARSVGFALANLRNAIYYNTYNSPMAADQGAPSGVVMRIIPGEAEPDVFLTAANTVVNCIGCHSVSADGSRLVAEEHAQPGLAYVTSSAYDLTQGGMGTNPAPTVSNLDKVGFAGLFPDGSLYLTTGRPTAGPLGGTGNVTGTFGPQDTQLYDADTGQEVIGAGAPKYALMPMFSSDGSQVIFNQLFDDGTGGHQLAVADFDEGTRQFGAPTTVFSDPAKYPGWPVFLPDVAASQDELVDAPTRRAIFALGSHSDFASQEAPIGITPHYSDLQWVDVDSNQVAQLATAGGFSNGNNYLPYGERDAHRDFYPTVSPVAAGGYFWLFFTSRRNYGNVQVLENDQAAETKKIWVSAIDIRGAAGADLSHPAFYLPGQELESGNIRAFAALEPCRGDGASCETGLDCCSGYCIDGMCGIPEEPRCSLANETCETTADCCPEDKTVCIGGYCAHTPE